MHEKMRENSSPVKKTQPAVREQHAKFQFTEYGEF
jgi:hypothetical protein